MRLQPFFSEHLFQETAAPLLAGRPGWTHLRYCACYGGFEAWWRAGCYLPRLIVRVPKALLRDWAPAKLNGEEGSVLVAHRHEVDCEGDRDIESVARSSA